MKASRPHWIRDKLLNVIVQMGLEKLPDLPDVPSALDLVTDAENKQVLELILIRQEPGRPFAAPPGVPADRLAALRRAFDATLEDAEFIADAAKLQMEIEPLTADEIDHSSPRPTPRRSRSCSRRPRWWSRRSAHRDSHSSIHSRQPPVVLRIVAQ